MNENRPTDLSELDELRRLLVGPNIEKLEQLAEKLDSPEKLSHEIGGILPQAMKISAQQGDRLSEAMIPTVEEIVRLSIKRDINKFANALFPVIGPAIRKSISETFRQMMQSLNQVLEYGLSWQGIKWRLESIRTGIPFAQIVLLHSLQFRVEQTFLIHRNTGLLLSHLELPENQSQNADMVSSMLSAIGDFVGDSFDVKNRQALDSIQVGDFSIWIEQSPDAILAVAIRGDAPTSLRATLQQSLEDIQSQFEPELSGFKSDTGPFEACRDILQPCMQSGHIQKQEGIPLKTKLIWLVIFILLAYWAISEFYLSMQQRDYIALLEKEPGYVITQVKYNGDSMTIRGLRDPLSRNPQNYIALTTLNTDKIQLLFEPYHSLDRPFIEQRMQQILQPPPFVKLEIKGSLLKVSGYASPQQATRLLTMAPLISGIDQIDSSQLSDRVDLSELNPPPGVKLALDLDSGHLQATGSALQDWIERTRAKALSIDGIRSYDDTQLSQAFDLSLLNAPPTVVINLQNGTLTARGRASDAWIKTLQTSIASYAAISQLDTTQLINADLENLQQQIQLLEKEMVFFDAAVSYIYDTSDLFNHIASLAKKIILLAQQLEKPVEIMIQGHSDSMGNFQNNVFLSIERAEYVAQSLVKSGISPRHLQIKGLEAPVEKEKSLAEQRYNRRVSFTVLSGPPPQN